MKELFFVIHFPALFRFYLFATLRSLLWGLVAFSLLFFLDFWVLLFHASLLEGWSLALKSHWLWIGFAILGFELFYGFLRLFALLSRTLRRLLQYLLPGLILFVLFGAPFSKLLESQDKLPYILFVCLVFVGGLFLAWRWPDFEHSNLVFLLGAALLSHFLIKAVFPLSEGFLALLLQTVSHFFLTVLLYINFHIRYRLQLAQGWEPVKIPLYYPKLGLLFFVLLVGFYLTDSFGAGFLWKGLSPALHSFLAVSAMLLLRWLLLLRQAIAPVNKSLTQILIQVRFTSLFLFVFGLFCLPGMYFLSTPSRNGIAVLQKLRTQSALYFAIAGSLLDFDRDGNSFWPGGDPDDKDPCIRLDAKNLCEGLSTNLLESSGKIQTTSHGKILVPKETPKRSLVFITVEGPQGSAAKPKYFFTANPHPWKKFLVPSNEPALALAALLYRRIGLLENSREDTTISSLFASFGYRTFCYSKTQDVNEDFFSKNILNKTFASCQIDLRGVKHKNIYNQFQQYKEKKNFVHLHFDWRNMPSGRFSRSIKEERLRWSRVGNVVVLLLQKKSPVAYLSAKENILRRQKEGFLDLAEVLLQSAGGKKGYFPKQAMLGISVYSPFQEEAPAFLEIKKADSVFLQHPDPEGQTGAANFLNFLGFSHGRLSAKEKQNTSNEKRYQKNRDTANKWKEGREKDLKTIDIFDTAKIKAFVQASRVKHPYLDKRNFTGKERIFFPRYTYRMESRGKKATVLYFDALTGAERRVLYKDLE